MALASIVAPQSRQIGLDALPQQAAGVHVLVNMPLALGANLTRVAEVLSAQYAVTYTRPDGATPKPRTPPRS